MTGGENAESFAALGGTQAMISITKEMIFVRCQNWIDQYFGKGYEVTYGISEYNIKSTDAMPTALAYAGNLGEGARHGMEYFLPWDWRTGMWETVHLFSRYAKGINVNTVSSNEEMISAYTSINESRDSMTVILVNRNESGTQNVQATITNFDCPDGTYDAYLLSNLPNGEETFVSHTQNALQKVSASVSNGKLSISIPAYSITAIILDLKDNSEKYAVTFVVDGETISSQRIGKGQNAVAPANPSKNGHTFKGWDKGYTNITQNTTVTAIFEPFKYTVSFYDDITHRLIDQQTVIYGENALEPTIPTHDGYLFAKWDKDFTNVSETLSVNAIFVERPSSNRYEAEKARVTNETVNIRESVLASGGKYVDVRSADMAFDVVVEFAGQYKLTIVYSVSDRTQTGDGSKYQKMYINREEPYTYVEFPKTGNDDPTFATLEYTITLDRGLNEIEFLKSWGWIDLDYIEITLLEQEKASYSELDYAIATAEALNESEYDETSWNVLSTALENAKAIDRNLYTDSQSVINQATSELQQAMNGLQKKVVAVGETTNCIKVFVTNRTIYIMQNGHETVSVFSIDGKCFKHIAKPDLITEIWLKNNGVYLVKVGSESYKVVVD